MEEASAKRVQTLRAIGRKLREDAKYAPAEARSFVLQAQDEAVRLANEYEQTLRSTWVQGAITQSFAKRYTPKTVEAIEALLSDEPDLDVIRTGIRALGFKDLRGISDALDRAMEAAESERGFHP